LPELRWRVVMSNSRGMCLILSMLLVMAANDVSTTQLVGQINELFAKTETSVSTRTDKYFMMNSWPDMGIFRG